MRRKHILHILHGYLLLWYHAPWNVIRNRRKVRIRSVPDCRIRVERPLHEPCPRGVVHVIRIVVAAEYIPWTDRVLHILHVQMILLYKCWKICRAHELALRSHCVCNIKFVHTKLVWHDNIHIIRNFSRDPMMSSDGLKPPDLVYILKCNSVHLIGSISLKQAAKSLHALSCALYIWKCNADYILLADTSSLLRLISLRRLIAHQWIRAEHSWI